MRLIIAFFILSVIAYSSATNVLQCHNIDKPIEDLNQRVKVGNCKKPPCRLRRNTVVRIALKITPDREIESVKNSIEAYIAGVPFPFVGYDQTDACQFMYLADGKEKAGCPLKAGQDYIYKNSIDVLQVYPRVKIVVHWAITANDGKDIICFEIPARITN